jgi:hypothetical protein
LGKIDANPTGAAIECVAEDRVAARAAIDRTRILDLPAGQADPVAPGATIVVIPAALSSDL